MSWSVSVTSKSKDPLKQKVDADQHIPRAIKDSIKAQIDAFPSCSSRADGPHGYRLETYGHIDSGGEWFSNCKVEITTIRVED